MKYASQLKESRDYLKKKYGGAGSFGPRKKEDRRIAVANPSANPGHACVWKTVEVEGVQIPFLIWTGGIPTTEEIHNAPNFTIFPSPTRVRGKLPYGESIKITDAEGSYDAMPWFVSERSDVPYDSKVDLALGLAFDWGGGELSTILNTDDDLRGETHDWGRGPIEIKSDDQAWPWAIERGFTLIKVPDALSGKNKKYAEVFVLDTEESKGNSYWWTQTPLRAGLLKFAEWQRQANPCFGLHVHGDQVVPVMRQLQGNPGKAAHLKEAHNRLRIAAQQLDVALDYLRRGDQVPVHPLGMGKRERNAIWRDACEYAYASIQTANRAALEYEYAGAAAYAQQIALAQKVMVPIAQVVLARAKCKPPAWSAGPGYDLDAAVAEYREYQTELEPWKTGGMRKAKPKRKAKKKASKKKASKKKASKKKAS